MKSGIYIITCLANNKVYIGRSVNWKDRISKHKSLLLKNTHANPHLQLSWNLYGEENFTFELLEEYEPEFLCSMENWWCNMLNSHNKDFGYNIEPTSPFGKIKNSTETRKKMSITNTGKKLSEETINKLRKINTGSKRNIDVIIKMRKHKRCVKIDCYSKIGDFIKTYNSIREAERELNIDIGSIRKCLKNKYAVVKGFIFKYNNDVLNKEEVSERNDKCFENKKKKVIGVNKNGTIIGIFDSSYQAEKITGINSYKISLCCRGIIKSTKKTKWEYYDNKT